MTEMAHFANMKSEASHKIWVEMNDTSFVIAMAIGVWTLCFNLAVNLSNHTDARSLSKIVSTVLYTGVWVLQLEGTLNPETASLIIVVCSLIEVRMYIAIVAELLIELVQKYEYTAKDMTYRVLYWLLFLAMILYNLLTRLQEYGDEVNDNYIMAILLFMWLT